MKLCDQVEKLDVAAGHLALAITVLQDVPLCHARRMRLMNVRQQLLTLAMKANRRLNRQRARRPPLTTDHEHR